MIDMVTRRKGEMVSMETQGDRVNIEFDMPSRGIIGLRTNVLTASQGEAIMAHRFKEYQPYKGDIPRRTNGSMIAMESGTAFAYAIDKLQDRGRFFIYCHEIEKADQHACIGFGRQGTHHSTGGILAGRSFGIHQGRRIRGSNPQKHAYA